MRLQIDSEFQQNEIKGLNEKYNVEMLENNKVESLKTFYSKAKKHTSQFLPALNSIRKSQYVRRQLT